MYKKQTETWKFILKYLRVLSHSKHVNFSLKYDYSWAKTQLLLTIFESQTVYYTNVTKEKNGLKIHIANDLQ